MTVGLDTSVVLRLLVGAPAHQAQAARRLFESQPVASVALSDIVVGETYFALLHHYDVPHAKAIAALSALLSDPRVRSTGVARRVLAHASVRDTGPGLMDRLIHAGYQRDDAALLTSDRAAARLPGARLI